MTAAAGSRPSAPLAHALVAGGLADPERLRHWRSDPALVARYGVDPAELDLDALADFAALSEKIRHNQCRRDLPLTFRLLRLTGLEITLFRDYAPEALARRRRGLTSSMERIDGLASFVERWASSSDPDRALVHDMLRHEHALALLRAAPPGQSGGAPPEDLACAVPAHRGRLLVRRLTCDPIEAAGVLRCRNPSLGRIVRQEYTVVYQRTSNDRLRVVGTDAGAGTLLLAVDGRTGVDGIAERVVGDGGSGAAVRVLVDQLIQAGLLCWREAGNPCV